MLVLSDHSGLTKSKKVKRKYGAIDAESDSSLEPLSALSRISTEAELSASRQDTNFFFILQYRTNLVGKMNWDRCLEEGQSESLCGSNCIMVVMCTVFMYGV
ncbi:hypothetical protein RO3G_16960 [Rhizopus delemar RA 99-880]|uniref:Uncharacterized protein n=1 Tax=Rhizopus delemar (strain RA 99-880 / ATCC MYA-4621 / FGSC 9543 / NRRL 43880) TaxID=246409 RepID=I1CVF8_RHIO9|nr:hypothetical protein RO3G_16960 [Rhizopus delemar RA 99-880]|eukprot:EIE92438.1 hypothetical protein RO3G_16960 [Rhizopus delemar RA 99-880]